MENQNWSPRRISSCIRRRHPEALTPPRLLELSRRYLLKCLVFKSARARLAYHVHKIRDDFKKNPSYSVTLSLKVGGGKDQIIFLEAAKIVTSLVGGC